MWMSLGRRSNYCKDEIIVFLKIIIFLTVLGHVETQEVPYKKYPYAHERHDVVVVHVKHGDTHNLH